MANSYLEKFFALTEQNINSRNFEHSFQASDCIRLSSFLTNSLYIGCMLVLFSLVHQQKHKLPGFATVLQPVPLTQVAKQIEEALPSSIPSLNVYARRQYLQPLSLKRMDFALLANVEIEEDYKQQAQLTDKVLVVPKLFG